MLIKTVLLYILVTVLAFISGMVGVGMAWKDMFQRTVMMAGYTPVEEKQFEVRNTIEAALAHVELLESRNFNEVEKSLCNTLSSSIKVFDPAKIIDAQIKKKMEELYLEAEKKLEQMENSGRCWNDFS